MDSHHNLEPFVGMVIRGSGALVTVHDAAGGEWRCVLRGRLRRMVGNATSPVVVGDRVEVRPLPGSAASRCWRRTWIWPWPSSRRHPGRR